MVNKKQAICICCGKEVEVSLFMSFVKVKCKTCKTNKSPINDTHMRKAEELQSAGKSKRSTSTTTGNTKPSTCTKCGASCEIGKFASHKTALCSDCKGTPRASGPVSVDIDMNKLDRSKIPTIEELKVSPIIIKNENLRKPSCPACGQGMSPLNVLEASLFGLVVSYQCDGCLGTMTFSEQARHKVRPNVKGNWFSYSGREIKGAISTKLESQSENTIQYLLDLLEQNGVAIEDIDGLKLPPWFNAISRKEFESLKEGIPYGFTTEEEILNGGDETEQVC